VSEFAAAVTCIDGRFHATLTRWVRERFDVEHVDLVTTPGASAALAARRAATTGSVLAHLAPSLEAHGTEVVVVAAHEGCAADPSDAVTQLAALPRAAATLRDRLGPEVRVVPVRLTADGGVTEVELGGAGHADDGARPGRPRAVA
jgi:carbonic anhydrase